MRRSGPVVLALLLVGSAALTSVAAGLRWASVCPVGGWDGDACLARQDHAYDVVPASAPWRAEPAWSVLGGSGVVLLALAVLLLPTALACRRWQRNALVLPALGVVLVGGAAIASGLLGRLVEVPVHALAIYLYVLVLPVALLLALPGPGPRRGWIVTALVLATPLPQALLAQVVVPYSSHDTSPWSELVVVPFLLTAALALRPWAPTTVVTGPDEAARPEPARSP